MVEYGRIREVAVRVT